MVASPATAAGQNSALVLSFRARLRSAWQNLLAARQAEAAKRSGVSNQESALSVKTPCTHAVWHIHYQNTTARIAPKDIGIHRGRNRKRLRCVHFGMEEYDARGAAAGGQDRRKRAYDDAAGDKPRDSPSVPAVPL